MPAAPPAQQGAASRSGDLELVVVHRQDHVALELRGALDESVQLDQLVPGGARPLRFDLAGVRRINSAGIHRWVLLLDALLRAQGRSVALHRLSPPFACQAFMIGRMVEGTRVVSVLVPYTCRACPWAGEIERAFGAPAPPVHPCPRCRGVADLDGMHACYATLLAG